MQRLECPTIQKDSFHSIILQRPRRTCSQVQSHPNHRLHVSCIYLSHILYAAIQLKPNLDDSFEDDHDFDNFSAAVKLKSSGSLSNSQTRGTTQAFAMLASVASAWKTRENQMEQPLVFSRFPCACDTRGGVFML